MNNTNNKQNNEEEKNKKHIVSLKMDEEINIEDNLSSCEDEDVLYDDDDCDCEDCEHEKHEKHDCDCEDEKTQNSEKPPMLGNEIRFYADDFKQAGSVLAYLRRDAEKNNVPILRPESAKYLEKIVRKTQPKKVLEIGTAIGYSGTIILSSCTSAELITLEKDEESIKKAHINFAKARVDGRVTTILGDCTEIVPELRKSGMKFDFIFLDGPKGQYPILAPDLIELLETGGTLLADNVLFRGFVNSEGIVPTRYKTIIKRLREFIKMCKENENFSSVIIEDIEDGLLIATKK
ncbi:MAG: O-methyltransferase [Clostridia bacterium]